MRQSILPFKLPVVCGASLLQPQEADVGGHGPVLERWGVVQRVKLLGVQLDEGMGFGTFTGSLWPGTDDGNRGAPTGGQDVAHSGMARSGRWQGGLCGRGLR